MIVTCGECSRDFDVPAKPEDIQRWKHGELIQRAMPYLTADQRELLITHTCGECFDAIFEERGGRCVTSFAPYFPAAIRELRGRLCYEATTIADSQRRSSVPIAGLLGTTAGRL